MLAWRMACVDARYRPCRRRGSRCGHSVLTERSVKVMTLFPRDTTRRDDELVTGSDAATRALSVTVVENEFVEGVYEKLASVYDLTFGPALQAGRIRAIQRMAINPGDTILEVGVGTGSNLSLYPRHGQVVGIDLSSSMLEKARERVVRERMSHVRLVQMDAADLKFADRRFDIVYAPYLISVVPDPVRVAREMRRVCRPGGRIVFLNHFLSAGPVMSRAERMLSPLTIHIGFRSDLDLPAFLAQAELKPTSIEKVNIPRIWSLVTCVEEH
ncbi:MAG: methyltransferase domain-containing protein [Luteitalea sp.]|nr:methyltransferase domain-containing protein [Luteitalea sp.]